jgi:hypothetical protein
VPPVKYVPANRLADDIMATAPSQQIHLIAATFLCGLDFEGIYEDPAG